MEEKHIHIPEWVKEIGNKALYIGGIAAFFFGCFRAVYVPTSEYSDTQNKLVETNDEGFYTFGYDRVITEVPEVEIDTVIGVKVWVDRDLNSATVRTKPITKTKVQLTLKYH